MPFSLALNQTTLSEGGSYWLSEGNRCGWWGCFLLVGVVVLRVIGAVVASLWVGVAVCMLVVATFLFVISGLQKHVKFGKDGRRKMIDPSKNFLKILDMGPIST